MLVFQTKEDNPLMSTHSKMTDHTKEKIGLLEEREQDDTEDEEVKMNCISGERGMHDSDFSSETEPTNEDQSDPLWEPKR